MKKIALLLILLSNVGTIPQLAVAATRKVTPSAEVLQDSATVVHKKKRVIKRQFRATRSQRMQMQLRQAAKHNKEAQREERLQQRIKKDTSR
ncbi:hypothetical protein [Mucilaginibacter xinganensis]|uniref:Uncharacterized protein n=1 Tax=Mucilaginibacter xinganensis TaxID=1234841 RepID=A0A223NR88_9SPHI|nr:hypothetical protein [Mucilaginibacter xinganensis]ASU32178.1 hypothetical protein MuYL_0275 [Mucilaginibacter xinganensis]